MKNIIQLFGILVIAASITGCASTKAYFIDRGRDAADIFTATASIGAGAKVEIGPVNIGLPACYLLRNQETGLRGGRFINHDNSVCEAAWILVYGDEIFLLNDNNRFKSYVFSVPLVDAPSETRNTTKYTQIDLVIGIGFSIRIGFNPGELIDFLLGWTTIDIYSDDIK